MMTLVERAHELLTSQEYINVATVSAENLPWNTPVYARYDERLIFYWSSWKDAEHSKNIRYTPSVFVTIYDSTRKRGDNNRRCLYLTGQASEMNAEDEIVAALVLLYPDKAEERELDKFVGASVRRLYKCEISAAWLNDKSERQVTNETLKMRVDVSLDALKAAISG